MAQASETRALRARRRSSSKATKLRRSAAALSGAGTSSALGARSLGGATARTALVTGSSSATGAMCTWWARGGAAFPSQPTGGRQRIMYIGGCAWHLDGLHHASGRLKLSTAVLEMETGLFF